MSTHTASFVPADGQRRAAAAAVRASVEAAVASAHDRPSAHQANVAARWGHGVFYVPFVIRAAATSPAAGELLDAPRARGESESEVQLACEGGAAVLAVDDLYLCDGNITLGELRLLLADESSELDSVSSIGTTSDSASAASYKPWYSVRGNRIHEPERMQLAALSEFKEGDGCVHLTVSWAVKRADLRLMQDLTDAIEECKLARVRTLLAGPDDVVLPMLNRFVITAAEDMQTPLMLAATYDHHQIVALLLARGADLRVTDEVGMSVVDKATQFQCTRSLKVLRELVAIRAVTRVVTQVDIGVAAQVARRRLGSFAAPEPEMGHARKMCSSVKEDVGVHDVVMNARKNRLRGSRVRLAFMMSCLPRRTLVCNESGTATLVMRWAPFLGPGGCLIDDINVLEMICNCVSKLLYPEDDLEDIARRLFESIRRR